MTPREKAMEIFKKLESLGFFDWLSESHNLRDTDMTPEYLDELPLNDIHRTVCNSMAFRWFREKGFICHVTNDLSNNLQDEVYVYVMTKGYGSLIDRSEEYSTYEEAELACLIKLIELCLNKKK